MISYQAVLINLVGNSRRGAEVGVFNGKTTEQLLARIRQLHLYAVDEWRVREPLAREGFQTYAEHNWSNVRATFDQRTYPFRNRLTVLQLDTVSAADHVADGSLDFVFIDAEHTYEAVHADIAAWRPKVRPGGILCGHDYGHSRFPGVKLAVDECFKVAVKETVWWTTI